MPRAPIATIPRAAATKRAGAPASGPGPRSHPPSSTPPAVRERRRLARRLAAWALMLTVWGGLALGVVLLVFAWDLPRPEAALETTRRPSVTLESADGRLLSTSGDLYGETVRLRDLPVHLPTALLAIEDRRFSPHFGLDPLGLLRAAWVNLTTGRVAQGGSTLTQQLAKNLFLTPERSLRRKVQEAMLALWLEGRFTKDQLLEIYLNRVYLGGGAYGVDAAARLYFGGAGAAAVVWQAAVLAGLPARPRASTRAPTPGGGRARGRRSCCRPWPDGGASTAAEAAPPRRSGSRFPPRPPARSRGWFADWVHDDLAAAVRQRRPRAAHDARPRAAGLRGGGRDGARRARRRRRASARARRGRDRRRTGAVRAMVGGRDYAAQPVQPRGSARRQPGSAFKPFVYLAALEHGLAPGRPSPTRRSTLGGWSPDNGAWRPRRPAAGGGARAQRQHRRRAGAGPRGRRRAEAAAVARRLGSPAPLPERRDDRAGHRRGEPAGADRGLRRLRQRRDAGGAARHRRRPRRRAARPGAAGRARARGAARGRGRDRRMLEAVVSRGSGRAAAVAGRPAAGKTGTTQDFRDAWFVGFSGGTRDRHLAWQRRRNADGRCPGRHASRTPVSRHPGRTAPIMTDHPQPPRCAP